MFFAIDDSNPARLSLTIAREDLIDLLRTNESNPLPDAPENLTLEIAIPQGEQFTLVDQDGAVVMAAALPGHTLGNGSFDLIVKWDRPEGEPA